MAKWGLFYGLKAAARLNCVKLIIESDSAILVHLVQSSCLSFHPLGSLIDGCKKMMTKMEDVNSKLVHIFRECNMAADALAKCSITHDLGLINFDSPPQHAAQAFLDDLCGVTRARRVGSCSNV